MADWTAKAKELSGLHWKHIAEALATVEAETREECAKVCDRNAWNRRTPKGEWVGDEIDCVQLSAQMAHEEDAAAIRSLPQASAEKKEPLSLNSNEQQKA